MAIKQQPLKQEDYSMKIIEDLGTIPTPSGTRKARFAIFECSTCKKHFKVRCSSTKAKQQTECVSCAITSHGAYRDPLYAIWNGIKQRCYSPARKDYHKYGGKGVTMCDAWKDDPNAFIDWCKTNGWSSELVVDKDIKSTELGLSPAIYSPETVSFITTQQNAEAANAKEVQQFDLEGNLVNTHVSTVAAALSLGKPKSSKSSIANCCRGIVHTAFGFKWKYTNN